MSWRIAGAGASDKSTRVMMVVANGVTGDSRVLKTAISVKNLGFSVVLYGFSATETTEQITGFPVPIILVPNPAKVMSRDANRKTRTEEERQARFIQIFSEHLAEHQQRQQPHILHTHDMMGLAIGQKLRELNVSPPFAWIHDVHEFVAGLTDIAEGKRSYYLQIEKEHIAEVDAITSVSPALSQILQKNYSLPIEPVVILNAPRFADFNPNSASEIRKTIGLSAGTPLVVYTGHVKTQRNTLMAVEFLRYLEDVHLALVTNSSGPYMDSVKAKASELGVLARLHLVPFVPYAEVTSFLRTADVGIHPIRRYPNSEIALPNKLFEYLHAGLPVVVSDNPSMAQFVKKHDCGLVFESEDAKALADSTALVLKRKENDHDWIKRFKQLARRFSWETQELLLKDVYAAAQTA